MKNENKKKIVNFGDRDKSINVGTWSRHIIVEVGTCINTKLFFPINKKTNCNKSKLDNLLTKIWLIQHYMSSILLSYICVDFY
jgi:hypothetical protein